MPSSLLPASLSRLSGAPVLSMALEELERLVRCDTPGVVATNSSEVGRFCAYWVPQDASAVFRVSAPFALRVRLRRLCRGYPAVRFLATGEAL